MNLAIMQPYFFPYIGYFQLIHAVDMFVFLDDVQYVKKSWINRNKLVLNGRPTFFTVPLQKAEQTITIKDVTVCSCEFDRWKHKFLMSIRSFYKKAPHYKAGMDLVDEVFSQNTESMSALARASVCACSNLLNMHCNFCTSSECFPLAASEKTERIINICKQAGAQRYINLPGGKELYSQEVFAAHNLELRFINPYIPEYSLGMNRREHRVSILDVLMCCGATNIRDHFIGGYELTC